MIPESRRGWLSRAVWLLALGLGVALTIWVVRAAGIGAILEAATRLGWTGFAVVCVASLCLFSLLGAALMTAAGEPVRRFPRFTFSRLAREAASDFLPLSQLGGLAVGARILRLGGVSVPRVYASMIVDQTTEIASQILFSLAGVAAAVAFLADEPSQAGLRRSIFWGTPLLGVLLILFLFGQRHFLRLASGLAHRLLPGLGATLADIDAELRRLYKQRGGIAASFVLNLLAWGATVGVSALILQFIGRPLGFGRLLAIEAAIATVRSVAFLMPAAIGLQEAAYTLVGPVFGLPADAAIALSLIKRARDGAMALVALFTWQLIEFRSATRRRFDPISE